MDLDPVSKFLPKIFWRNWRRKCNISWFHPFHSPWKKKGLENGVSTVHVCTTTTAALPRVSLPSLRFTWGKELTQGCATTTTIPLVHSVLGPVWCNQYGQGSNTTKCTQYTQRKTCQHTNTHTYFYRMGVLRAILLPYCFKLTPLVVYVITAG